jgi:glycosyltransferase involved in cell wall biosynthesis
MLDNYNAAVAPGPQHEPDRPGNHGPQSPKVRLIAFYLPQFHPIPENDAWWGAGFTEWTNVTKALPRFAGHVQPRLPADLGFYDLREATVMRRQIALARRYGIHGFCFHYYWFNGRRILEAPLDLLLADPSLDMPFCINWANENWTRRWDGHEDDVLLAQAHSPEDDVAFARNLIAIVKDPRYITIDGRPVVMIYRPGLLPNAMATLRRWRAEFGRAGVMTPYVVMAQGFNDLDPRLHGLDAACEFPPHKLAVTSPINATLHLLDPNFTGHVLDYNDVARHAMSLAAPPYKLFRCVSPSWDNEARRPGAGFTLAHATPAAYGRWLDWACATAMAEAGHPDERIVFINAWNEWAEGAYLEPDRHFGHAYLAETARVLHRLEPVAASAPAQLSQDGRTHLALVSHDARFHGAQVVALALARSLVIDHNIALRVLIGGPGELTSQFEDVAPTETVPGEFNDAAAWRQAARRLAKAGVTAVLLNTLVSARATIAMRGAGLRIVQLVHELPSLIRQYKLEEACRDAAAHAAAVVFPSAFVRDQFLALAGPIRGRTVLRHQGLHMTQLTPDQRAAGRQRVRHELGVTDDQRLILGVGYGEWRKGIDLWPFLIKAVISRHPGTMFVWVGKVEPTLQHWLTHDLRVCGLAQHLIFYGTTNVLFDLYAAADAFILTSREDPFPSVVVEAMAAGLPTLVFRDSGGIVDLVEGAGGVVVPYLDLPAMADALVAILDDDDAARETGRRLARRIAGEFAYADYAADLIALARPPAVSVVVPNFNYAKYLRQRIESIWAQTVTVAEIIILDDHSTDDSEAVIAELAQRRGVTLRVVRNDVNSGSVSRQWARGVALAQGDLVWIAEADDFADPAFLAGVLPAFDDRATVLSYSQSRMVDEDGRVIAPDYLGYVADIDPVRWTDDFRASGPEEVAGALAVKNVVPNVSAAVFRRAALAAVLETHLEAMAACQNAADWLCYIRLLQDGGAVAFTARPLNNHRRHAKGITIANADRRHFEEIVAMQDLAASVAPVSPATRAVALSYRAAVARQFGLAAEAAA